MISWSRNHKRGKYSHIMKERLLTPVGLRTLAPEDIRFCAAYMGGPERDAAYHQGTVWPFLLGPFVTAWVKTYGASSSVRCEARTFLDGLLPHLDEACLGQVSEIFDGQKPHQAAGCCAQAWSVAEPLRALIEDIGVIRETLSRRSESILLKRVILGQASSHDCS